MERIEAIRTKLSRKQVAEEISHSLEEREVLLRIQNMNLYEIELNCRVERLAEFKVLYGRSVAVLGGILKTQIPGIGDDECENFCLTFGAFLFGVYPFVFHTKKQLEAMKRANIRYCETSIYQMAYECLIRILPIQIKEEDYE